MNKKRNDKVNKKRNDKVNKKRNDKEFAKRQNQAKNIRYIGRFRKKKKEGTFHPNTGSFKTAIKKE